MKDLWKQLGDWVIELKGNSLFKIRARLILIYILSIFFILMISEYVDSRLAFLIGVLFSYGLANIALKPIKEIIAKQRRLFRNITHDLRTPLSIIKMNSDIALLESDFDKKITTKRIKSNLEEIERLSKIIKSLFYLTPEIDDKNKMTLNNVNLFDVIKKSEIEIKELAEKRKIRLFITSQNKDTHLIRGNEIALKEMIINLIKNSIIYTPRGGIVRISIEPISHNKIEIKIKDNGIGINSNDLPHIFEPFYKADQSRIKINEGHSGLGLTIVKEIVRRHNGSINIKSVIGKGTLVSLIFSTV